MSASIGIGATPSIGATASVKPTTVATQEVASKNGYTFIGPNRRWIGPEIRSGAIKIAKARKPPRSTSSAPALVAPASQTSACWTGPFKFVVKDPHDFVQTVVELTVAQDGTFTYRGSTGIWPTDKKVPRTAKLWPERFKKEAGGKGICSGGVLYFTAINNTRMKRKEVDNAGAFPQGIADSDYRLVFDDGTKRGGAAGIGFVYLEGKSWPTIIPDTYEPNSLVCIARGDVLYFDTLIPYESALPSRS
jgi:hypothetical protein